MWWLLSFVVVILFIVAFGWISGLVFGFRLCLFVGSCGLVELAACVPLLVCRWVSLAWLGGLYFGLRAVHCL